MYTVIIALLIAESLAPGPKSRPTEGTDALGLQSRPTARQQQAQPTLDEVVDRMSRYVAGYGEQASLIVAVEKYQQTVSAADLSMRRQLTAEFVIVRTEGRAGWLGLRDVNEVDGKDVTQRRDRLQQLLIGQTVDTAAINKIADESSRYNVGPTVRNFNVPTTALFFFHPSTVARFTFRKVGASKVSGREVWELTFTETVRPTLVMKRDGTDVPCAGTVWVAPGDGTVVRTRLRLEHFADTKAVAEVVDAGAPALRVPPTNPTVTVVGSGSNATTVETKSTTSAAAQAQPEARRREVDLNSVADIEVSYEHVQKYDLWLPVRMKEVYVGAMTPSPGSPVRPGRAVTEAKYSDFKQFQTSVKIAVPK